MTSGNTIYRLSRIRTVLDSQLLCRDKASHCALVSFKYWQLTCINNLLSIVSTQWAPKKHDTARGVLTMWHYILYVLEGTLYCAVYYTDV